MVHSYSRLVEQDGRARENAQTGISGIKDVFVMTFVMSLQNLDVIHHAMPPSLRKSLFVSA